MDKAFTNNIETGIKLLIKQVHTLTSYVITPIMEEILYDKLKMGMKKYDLYKVYVFACSFLEEFVPLEGV